MTNKAFKSITNVLTSSFEEESLNSIELMAMNILDECNFDYVLISKPVDETCNAVITELALSKDGKMDNFSYSLADTPCDNVFNQEGICSYGQNVANLFPNDHLLEEMGIQSYIGAPLYDKNKKITSIIVFLGKETVTDEDTTKLVIDFFSHVISLEKYKFDLQNEKKELEKQILHEDRLRVLGEMTASIGHEINNPLAVINGKVTNLLHRLEKDKYDKEILTKDLTTIQKHTLRIASLTDQFMSFSKKTDEFDKFSLNRFLEEEIQISKHIFKKTKITFNSNFHTSDDQYIYGSKPQLSQIIINILINAKDALESTENPTINLRSQFLNDKIIITISNNGPEIEKSEKEKIFNPFHSTKSPEKGTGLGLSISHKIITNHQGTLSCESSNEWTNFVITLPSFNEI
jgi:signal transduction histidine kinase